MEEPIATEVMKVACMVTVESGDAQELRICGLAADTSVIITKKSINGLAICFYNNQYFKLTRNLTQPSSK
jgi:hypothetical protein